MNAENATTSATRVVAEYCPGCQAVHIPQQPGTGQQCRTCRYYAEGLIRVVDAVEKALRAFGDNLDRDRAGRLLAMWKHAGRLNDREREAVLARFGS